MKINKSVTKAFFVFTVFLLFNCTTDKTLLPDEHLSWQRTTEIELDYPIPGHEDHYRRIFINDIGRSVQVSEEGSEVSYRYPPGTVIIKEVYDEAAYNPQSKPALLTAMVKNPEHPDARSGWVWVVKNLEKGTEEIIEEEFCVTCHAAANTPHPYGDKNISGEFRDFVFFPYDGKD